jgi:hypothetical protein
MGTPSYAEFLTYSFGLTCLPAPLGGHHSAGLLLTYVWETLACLGDVHDVSPPLCAGSFHMRGCCLAPSSAHACEPFCPLSQEAVPVPSPLLSEGVPVPSYESLCLHKTRSSILECVKNSAHRKNHMHFTHG